MVLMFPPTTNPLTLPTKMLQLGGLVNMAIVGPTRSMSRLKPPTLLSPVDAALQTHTFEFKRTLNIMTITTRMEMETLIYTA